jgi:hypothetical protein
LEPQVIIQFLLVPAVVLAVVLSLRSRNSVRGQARRKILAVLTVVAGSLSVIFPSLLQDLADSVGVTRGTDLLLYGLAVLLIYLVGSVSVRSALPARWRSPRPSRGCALLPPPAPPALMSGPADPLSSGRGRQDRHLARRRQGAGEPPAQR